MVENTVDTLLPSTVKMPITTIAINTKIKAYSTNPCPSSYAKKLRSITNLQKNDNYNEQHA
jgi:hypothetical protein